MRITPVTPADACKAAGGFLEILKTAATHELAMPGGSLWSYHVFAENLDETMKICASKAPTTEDCVAVEAFLGLVANALPDGHLFPGASRRWKQAFIDAIEVAGGACSAVTGSLDDIEEGADDSEVGVFASTTLLH